MLTLFVVDEPFGPAQRDRVARQDRWLQGHEVVSLTFGGGLKLHLSILLLGHSVNLLDTVHFWQDLPLGLHEGHLIFKAVGVGSVAFATV